MADPMLINVPLWGLIASFVVLLWALSLCVRLITLWRWTTEMERWKMLQRKRREDARRLLGLT